MGAPNGREDDAPRWPRVGLSAKDFGRLSEFIQRRCGIQMPPVKKTLLECRLGRRLRALGMSSYAEYCERVLGEGDDAELVHMVDEITTNKTDFFREPRHFELLGRDALPDLAERHGAGVRRELQVWSAGCSTGQEPYTLAVVLSELGEAQRGLRFRILGTDLSTRVLRVARAAVYTEADLEPVPILLRRKYFLRSVEDPHVVRVGPRLRSLVQFGLLNLLDADYGLPHRMDVIFCRNVFIYFDRRIQAEVLRRFAGALVPGGFLFLGHSESISGLDVPFELLASTAYRKRD